MNLHPYQRRVVDFALDCVYSHGHKGAGQLLDPGLGKTICTLEAVQTLRMLGEIKRTLIIAPKQVCLSVWPQEIAKWGYPFRTLQFADRVKQALCERPGDVEIVNYESLHHLVDCKGRWDLVVCDEATKIKNWTSVRMKNLRKMLPFIQTRMILTGDPVANSLGDIFSQIFVLDDGDRLGKNVTVFRARYMYQNGGYCGTNWNIKPGVEDEIYQLVSDITIRLDAESNLDMPKLVTNDIYCQLPPNAAREYKRLKRELLAQLNTGDVLALNSASAYMKAKQFANGAVYDTEHKVHEAHTEKLDMFNSLVDELYGKPLLVFYQFDHDLVRIQERFKSKVVGVLNGKTKPRESQQLIERWNRGELPLFLVQNQKGSHGVNLQEGGCADVAYFGLNDSPELYNQSFRRVYRQGVKAKTVKVHRFLTAGTVDEVIADRLQRKHQTQQEFFQALKKHARSV